MNGPLEMASSLEMKTSLEMNGLLPNMTRTHPHPLEAVLESRIAIIDGAMGTTIRTYGMKETDIRGERFKDSKKDQIGRAHV